MWKRNHTGALPFVPGMAPSALFGCPKFVADIQFEEDRVRRTCHLKKSGKHIQAEVHAARRRFGGASLEPGDHAIADELREMKLSQRALDVRHFPRMPSILPSLCERCGLGGCQGRARGGSLRGWGAVPSSRARPTSCSAESMMISGPL